MSISTAAPQTHAQAVQQHNRRRDGRYAEQQHGEGPEVFLPPVPLNVTKIDNSQDMPAEASSYLEDDFSLGREFTTKQQWAMTDGTFRQAEATFHVAAAFEGDRVDQSLSHRTWEGIQVDVGAFTDQTIHDEVQHRIFQLQQENTGEARARLESAPQFKYMSWQTTTLRELTDLDDPKYSTMRSSRYLEGDSAAGPFDSIDEAEKAGIIRAHFADFTSFAHLEPTNDPATDEWFNGDDDNFAFDGS